MKIFYSCELIDNPVANRCTRFVDYHNRILNVIQQRYNSEYKYTWWGPIDRELADQIGQKLQEMEDDLDEDYMIDHHCDLIPVRKLLWALRLPKIPKEPWETRF